jgi:hypothetical protein
VRDVTESELLRAATAITEAAAAERTT